MGKYTWKQAWDDANKNRKSNSSGFSAENNENMTFETRNSGKRLTERNPYASRIVQKEKELTKESIQRASDEASEKSQDSSKKSRDAIERLFGIGDYQTASGPEKKLVDAMNTATGNVDLDKEYRYLVNSGEMSESRLNLSKVLSNVSGRFSEGVGNFASDTLNTLKGDAFKDAQMRTISGILGNKEINNSASEDLKLISDYVSGGGDISDFESAQKEILSKYGKKVQKYAYDAYKNSERKAEDTSNIRYNTRMIGKTAQSINDFAGNVAESVGGMIIPMAVGSAIPSSEGSGAISTIINQYKSGATVGQALKAGLGELFRYNTTTALMSLNAAKNKYVEASKQYGNNPMAVNVNAIGTGLVEYISENLNDINDIESLSRFLSVDATGGFIQTFIRGLPNLLVGAAEEAGEEVFSTTVENLMDKVTGEHDKKWFGYGNGSVFDAKELIDSGLSGFSIGVLFGSVAMTANAIASSRNIRQQADVLNDFLSQFPEEIRPNYVNPNTVTQDQISHIVDGTYDLLVAIARYSNVQFVANSDGTIGFAGGSFNNPGIKMILDDINGTSRPTYESNEWWFNGASVENTDASDSTFSGTSGADQATGRYLDTGTISPEDLREKQDADRAQEREGNEADSSSSNVPEQLNSGSEAVNPGIAPINGNAAEIQSTTEKSGFANGITKAQVAEYTLKYAESGASMNEVISELEKSGLVANQNSLSSEEVWSIFRAWQDGNRNWQEHQSNLADQINFESGATDSTEQEHLSRDKESKLETSKNDIANVKQAPSETVNNSERGSDTELVPKQTETAYPQNGSKEQKGRNTVIREYGEYNSRRYGKPWVGYIGKDGKPQFHPSVGDYTGSVGKAGKLYIFQPQEGMVYMFGQKDYRGTSDNRYVVYRDGQFIPIEKKDVPDAVDTFYNGSEKQLAPEQEPKVSDATGPNLGKEFGNQTVQSDEAKKESPIDTSEVVKDDEQTSGIVSDVSEGGKPEASLRASDEIKNRFLSGTLSRFGEVDKPAFNRLVLQKICDEAFGGTMAEGAYSVKDMYDAMELAVNRYIIENASMLGVKSASAAKSNIAKLDKMLSVLPTQTNRTAEQEQYQQFSTPPTIAYAAAWVANILKGEVVLEPSAGVGGIAVFAKAYGADVFLNELDSRRRSLLESIFERGHVTEEDALHIQDVASLDNVDPDVVLMNPPFSSQITTGSKTTNNSFSHVNASLSKLKNGGRLVAILGAGRSLTDPDSKGYTDWLGKLKERYRVSADVRIDGSQYRKYGTTFNVRLLVIDKIGPQGIAKTIKADVKQITDIPDIMKTVHDARDTIRSQESASRMENYNRKESDTSIEKTKTESNPVQEKNPEKGREVIESETVNHTEAVQTSDSVHKKIKKQEESAPATTAVKTGKSDVNLETDENGNVVEKAFVDYEAPTLPDTIPTKNRKKHPGKLVESTAMASVSLPPITVTPNLPINGAWSDAQMVNIVYAKQSFEKILPDGKRRGYMIGDGTGVGKGREIAGILMDAFRSGDCKKAIWISNSQDLYHDAIRDLTDCGWFDEKLGDFVNYDRKNTDKLPKQGILYTTYNMMAHSGGSNSSGEKIRNSELIKNWLGNDWQGVIIYDEAHNMANSLDTKASRGVRKASAKALAGVDFQDAFPLARVVYVSGTAAKDVNTLLYANRLGLWGEGTAFKDKREFADSIKKAGTAAMELVVRDMKAMGVYNARSLSYDGVTFRRLQHNLTTSEIQNINKIAEGWRIVLNNMREAADVTNAPMRNMQSAFWGANNRFWKSYYASIGAYGILDELRKNIKNGVSSVVQISLTGEANQKEAERRAIDQGLSIDEAEFTSRAGFLNWVEHAFPTQMFDVVKDENGNERRVPTMDSKGNPVISRDAVQMRDDLLAQLRSLPFPESPLDIILGEFGSDVVAEISGRSSRRELVKDASGEHYEMRKMGGAQFRMAEANAFNNGKKRIAVVTDAGATGISLHASAKFKNQEKRVMYNVDPSENINTFVQAQGRVHRSGQVQLPEFVLVSSNIPGQNRFTSSITHKMQEMGAATRGERSATMDMFGRMDDLNNREAVDAIEGYLDSLSPTEYDALKDKLHEGFKDKNDSWSVDPTRFLNRIQNLSFGEQTEIYKDIQERLRTIYEGIDEGEITGYDRGLQTRRVEKIDVLKDIVVRTGQNGEKTHYIKLKTWEKPNVKTLSGILKRRSSGKFLGLWETKQGKLRAVFDYGEIPGERGEMFKRFIWESVTTSRGESVALHSSSSSMSSWTPVLLTVDGTSYSNGTQRKLLGFSEADSYGRNRDKFTTDQIRDMTADIGKMEKLWEKAMQEVPELTPTERHIFSGALLPAWDMLGGGDRAITAERIISPSETYLGYVVPAKQVDSILDNFGVKAEKETPEQIYNGVMSGETYSSGGIGNLTIKQSLVNGEKRIELLGRNGKNTQFLQWNKRLLPEGAVFQERIGSDYRVFISTNKEKAILAIKRLTDTNSFYVKQSESTADESLYRVTPRNEAETNRNGESDQKTLTGPENKPNTSISIQDTIDEISRMFGVQITHGYMRNISKNVSGIYNTEIKGIRYRNANDIRTVAHELGHALDDRYGILNSDSLADSIKVFSESLSPALYREYQKSYEKQATGRTSAERKKNLDLLIAKEGLADMLAAYLADPDIIDKYSWFENEFIEKLSEDDRQKLERSANMVHVAVSDKEAVMRGSVHRRGTETNPFQRVKEFVSGRSGWTADETKENRKSIRRRATEKFIRDFFDANHYLMTLGYESESGNIEAYTAANNAVNVSGGVESALLGDIRDLDGAYIGDGFHTVLEDLTGKDGRVNDLLYDEFGIYLILRHVGERKAQGQVVPDVFDDDKFVKDQIALYEERYPQFSETAEKFYKYRQNILEYARRYGLISQETIDHWNEIYPNHVSMTRYLGEKASSIIDKVHRGGSNSPANQSSPYKRTKGGSKLDYWNGLDLAMEETTRVIKAAYANNTMQAIVALSQDFSDSASIMERVPLSLNVDRVGTGELVDKLDKKINKLKKDSQELAIDTDTADSVWNAIRESIPETLTSVTQVGRSDESKRIVTVMVDGKKQMWKVNDELLYPVLVNLTGMGKDSVPVKLIASMNRFVVGFITGKNVFFSATNAMRDLGTVAYKISSGGIGGSDTKRKEVVSTFFKNLLTAYAQQAKQRWKGIGSTSEYHKEYVALKGNDSGLYLKGEMTSKDAIKAFNEMNVRTNADRISRNGKDALRSFRDALSIFSFIGNTIEQSPREALFVTARTLGYDAQTALRMSEEITVDFHSGGIVSKQLNKFIPFFNASMQGMYEKIKHDSGFGYEKDGTAKPISDPERRKRAISRIALILGMSLATALIMTLINMYRRDDYTRLSNYTKNNYYCIPVGNGKFLTLPKPREWSVTESIFERLMESATMDNEYALDGDATWEYVSDMLLPSGIASLTQGDIDGVIGSIGILGTFYESGANKDFLGRSIVPSYMENLSPRNQYTGSTTWLAWALGQATNVSPMKIDHIGSNLLGGAWKFIKAVMPIDNAQRDYSLGFANLFVRDPAYSTDLVNRLYNERDKAKTAKADNPEDMEAAIDYKWYNSVASFYSRYSSLAKNQQNSDQKHETRMRVLDIIEGTLLVKNGNLYVGQEMLEEYVRRSQDTSVMPAVMADTIKYGENFSESVSLTPDQYVEFQMIYNGFYWDYVNQAFSKQLSDAQRKIALDTARDQALVDAKNRLLKSLGVNYTDATSYSSAQSSRVSITDYAKVKDFKNKPGKKRDDVVFYINSLPISDKKKTALYYSMGYSESSLKNAPWFS